MKIGRMYAHAMFSLFRATALRSAAAEAHYFRATCGSVARDTAHRFRLTAPRCRCRRGALHRARCTQHADRAPWCKFATVLRSFWLANLRRKHLCLHFLLRFPLKPNSNKYAAVLVKIQVKKYFQDSASFTTCCVHSSHQLWRLNSRD